jgi:telomerase protein component 1
MSKTIDSPPYRWRTARVFISSTFRDFHAERDYLVKYVFPDLRQWCEQWKLHLVDIDLRWGVTAAEAESGKVIDICLKNIDGSRPFFLCLLGNRYGWVPKRQDIPPETLESFNKLKDPDKQAYSITHMEIHHAVLSPLTSTDVFEATPHAFFYFRDERALPAADSISAFNPHERAVYAQTFCDPQHYDKLQQLKAAIREHYRKLGASRGNSNEEAERIFEYTPMFEPTLPNSEDDQLQGRLTKESLKEFGERVKSDLQKAIGMEFSERIQVLSQKRDEDKLESERDYQEAFVENRTGLFIGRTALLNQLFDYIDDDSRQILAVYGDPGSGKSALLAHFYRLLTDSDYAQKYIPQFQIHNPKLFAIPHFIGASPESSSLVRLLTRICEELKQKFAIEDEIPFEANKLHEAFWAFLAKVTAPTVILIDGLNQLDETEDAHSLYWLPRELPDNVKIITSTLEGDTREALQKKTDLSMTVTPLTVEEREEIIRLMPSVFCKTMSWENIDILKAKQETENPLYLKVAIDELRVFGSHEKLGAKIRELPANVVDLYVYMLDRLVQDHGSEVVERLFCLLECSRYGLTLGELAELMAPVDQNNTYLVILRQIRDYIHNRGELIDFFHRSLSKAIRKKYFEEAG